MIRHISIKNFATIEKAEIDFHSGLNTITGETGAGKSVAVEAMSLARERQGRDPDDRRRQG